MVHVEELALDFTNMCAEPKETMVAAEDFPETYAVFPGKSYPVELYVFHIKASGNFDLLGCRPSKRIVWSHPVYLDGNDVCFQIRNLPKDIEHVRKESERVAACMQQQFQYLRGQVESYNNSLRNQIKSVLSNAKQREMRRLEDQKKLGLPIKQSTERSATYAIKPPQMPSKIISESDRVASH